MKVTVCGAAGGIGQPLSLLLKLSPLVDELSLFDVVNAPGVGADLSHIDTNAKVTSHLPDDNGLAKALNGTDLVIIPAGVPRKPGMTRDDLFAINAGIVRDLAQGVAENAPNAFVLVISNPVNSTVPIFAEVLKKNGVFNARKLFGVTTLDLVRANTFISQLDSSNKIKPSNLNVPVIGGHSGETIVPLFSLGAPEFYKSLDDEQRDALVHRVQYGGDEVVQAKKGAGSATLSMAYSGFKLAEELIESINGKHSFVDSSFIYLSDEIEGAKEAKQLINNESINYISLPVKLGPRGVESIEYDVLNKINDHEKELLSTAIDQLTTNISKGVNFIKNQA
ncbi:Malate dehydrogenase [Wickerhamomyces ciferrii]|uniref:Malate dehydrogenase n=1 Tax=Wickerhamomyces ciferrii (strain ATCC 14091 / BCRC 22168 / CBS 111 / JCM 3599 / NBRC 0793 / NRRL Y-1031 F-60-10) TaxID=1206466 RepID=K0KSX7_WICCF|nr:Malate dehydrogenase [Wickerhamomyces ciferrii]CCH44438.1 Malate dehydrogenase [Wickerhamomyces ciferrii]